jgi:hypothetical protein
MKLAIRAFIGVNIYPPEYRQHGALLQCLFYFGAEPIGAIEIACFLNLLLFFRLVPVIDCNGERYKLPIVLCPFISAFLSSLPVICSILLALCLKIGYLVAIRQTGHIGRRPFGVRACCD